MIKVVITDFPFESADVEESILAPLGCGVTIGKQKLPQADLIQLVADAEHILSVFAPLTATVIAGMRKAKVIVRYGVGVDNVDLEAARAHGIPVCNVPDYCMDEVADQALALMLAMTRQVVANCQYVRGGTWGLAVPEAAMKALSDLAVGVVGLGRIGRQVVARLKGFRCRLLGHDPMLTAAQISSLGCEPMSLPELLSQSDLVTLHCPATAQTRQLLKRDTLAGMKRGAILINVGRGTLVDTAALVEALKSGHLAGAGLDVFDPEPLPPDHPLLKMDNVVVASHVAAVSAKAIRRLRETAAGIVARAVRGEPLPNVVNGVAARTPNG